MATVWSQSPEAIIKDLIADKNSAFDGVREKFTIGAPTPYTPTDDSSRNTEVIVSPDPASNFRGDVPVRYKRITLETSYKVGLVPTFPSSNGTRQRATNLLTKQPRTFMTS